MTASSGVRPVIFGEVLFDSFPDGSNVLGGAPFNVAWNLQRLGAEPLFVGAVGTDELGERVCAAMASAGLDLRGLQIVPYAPTGRVQVTLEVGEPCYDILPNQAYDRVDPGSLAAFLTQPLPMLYHGSLALRAEPSRSACNLLAGRADRRFVDVNLRPPWYQADSVLEMLRGADYVKLNRDELRELTRGTNDGNRVRDLIERAEIREAVVLTSGSEGAGIHTNAGDRFDAGAPAVTDLRDPVGAGDAFASVTILGILEAWPWETTLARALDFAARVCTLQGATTTDPSFYAAARVGWAD
ncbi:Fructokinase [Thioalkalivibrio nitratireducens DSM 14787]|uniref:Fructokinase n=1 Tax=Thioalkalivibrio nitratireducens (strain DSM 14787 / UNIQEM 213 / ALEN2) TaxID=1255043 RepID=L0E3Z9_THIND|nr:PfkB family carbohydrate kinase [Thioalkalivibrio nitratireducens]AGA35376.1 Fructokinase [Thioalkalivibrio nitratireducens DSM 14787]